MNEPTHEGNQDSAPRKRRKAGGGAEPLRLAIPDRQEASLIDPANQDQAIAAEPATAEATEVLAPDDGAASAPAVSDEERMAVDGPVQDAADNPSVASEAGDEPAAGEESAVDLATLEALLFSTHHPLTTPRLAELMELKSPAPLRKAIKALNSSYEESGRSFRVEQVAGGYQLLTLPEYGDYLKRLHQKEIDAKLTKAALETLAIIAYKQPILRADVEAIRGVACGETIRSLMEKHLVRIAGRAEEPGRPILYGTTKRFLELFGLNSLKDLPQADELRPPGGVS